MRYSTRHIRGARAIFGLRPARLARGALALAGWLPGARPRWGGAGWAWPAGWRYGPGIKQEADHPPAELLKIVTSIFLTTAGPHVKGVLK